MFSQGVTNIQQVADSREKRNAVRAKSYLLSQNLEYSQRFELLKKRKWYGIGKSNSSDHSQTLIDSNL